MELIKKYIQFKLKGKYKKLGQSVRFGISEGSILIWELSCKVNFFEKPWI